MAYYRRTKYLFVPGSKLLFKLSRSKIEQFIRCKRCFYLDRRLGLPQPSIPSFTLNNAVDALFKKEFDQYRAQGESHPIMKENQVVAIPFQHPDLNTWRDPFKGIQFHDPETNFLIFGGVDDLWLNSSEELIIVDYKATSQEEEVTLEGKWKDSYKRQMEIYQWLFRQNQFEVSSTGYFVYANGLKDRESFSNRLEFKTVLIPYKGKDDWIRPVLTEIKECLMSDTIPQPHSGCEHCSYREQTRNVEAEKSTPHR